jgi:hypothetical protein
VGEVFERGETQQPCRSKRGPERGEQDNAAVVEQLTGAGQGEDGQGLTPVPGGRAAGGELFEQVAGEGFIAGPGGEVIQQPSSQGWGTHRGHERSSCGLF